MQSDTFHHGTSSYLLPPPAQSALSTIIAAIPIVFLLLSQQHKPHLQPEQYWLHLPSNSNYHRLYCHQYSSRHHPLPPLEQCRSVFFTTNAAHCTSNTGAVAAISSTGAILLILHHYRAAKGNTQLLTAFVLFPGQPSTSQA